MFRLLAALSITLGIIAAQAHADTVLITGANRGIGLEFARQYAERGYAVIATTRRPAEADDLKALATNNKNVTVERLEVTDVVNVNELAAKYHGRPIDILLNNAGVLGDTPKQSLGAFDAATFRSVMDTNVLGALLVTEAFRQNVAESRQKKIIALTSDVALSGEVGPGLTFYRASKAALSIGLRTIGAEIGHGVLVGLLIPGAVDTDMLRGSGYKGPSLTPAAAAEKMIGLIDRLTPAMAKKAIGIDGHLFDW